jgi:hypothetical protein
MLKLKNEWCLPFRSVFRPHYQMLYGPQATVVEFTLSTISKQLHQVTSSVPHNSYVKAHVFLLLPN